MSAHKLMTFGMCGSSPHDPEYNPYEVTKTDTAQKILLRIAHRPMTVEKIVSSTQIESGTVESTLQKLCKVGLVVQLKEGFVANFVILTNEPKVQIERLTRPKGEIIAKEIQKHINEIREVVQTTSQPLKGWDYDRLCWVVNFAILMDTGVVDRGLKRYGITTASDAPERPGGGQYWFRGMEGEPPYKWSFGQEVETYEKKGFAYWYEWRQTCQQLPKPHPMTFGTQVVSVMHTLHELDSSTVEDISAKVGIEASLIAEILESGVTWGCVLAEDKRFRPNFPLFESNEIADIGILCDKISDIIIEEAYLPLLSEIEQIRLKYYTENPVLCKANFVTNWELWVREFALEHLVDKGILPPFNAPQIAHFWGWKGSWKII